MEQRGQRDPGQQVDRGRGRASRSDEGSRRWRKSGSGMRELRPKPGRPWPRGASLGLAFLSGALIVLGLAALTSAFDTGPSDDDVLTAFNSGFEEGLGAAPEPEALLTTAPDPLPSRPTPTSQPGRNIEQARLADRVLRSFLIHPDVLAASGLDAADDLWDQGYLVGFILGLQRGERGR